MSTTTLSSIRVGVIGFGLSGRVFHAPLIAASDRLELAVIATSDPARQAEARAAYPDAVVVATPAELIGMGLDLVVVASPVHVHFEQALAALEAGSAVVVDKPFVPTLTGAKTLVAKAEEVDRALIVYQNRRWDADLLTLQRVLPELGEVFRFESTFERFSPALRDRWQDTRTPADGAGVLFDLGSHLIDQALHLFGPATLEQAELRTVRDGGVSDDDSFLSLLHTNGIRSHLTMSRMAAASGPRLRVLGDKSAYTVYGLDVQEPQLKNGLRPGDAGYGVVPEADWATVGGEPVAMEAGDYPAFYAAVAATLLDGAPAPVDVRDSIEVVRIIEHARELARLTAS